MENNNEMLDSYFKQRDWLLKYFQIENTEYYNYHFQRIDAVWDFVGGCDCRASLCAPGHIIWGQGSETHKGVEVPIPLSFIECGYKQSAIKVSETPLHTLVYAKSNMGGSDNALIFDNEQQFSMQDHMRWLQKRDLTHLLLM